MADILVFSEQDAVAFELLSKARELGGAVSAAMLGTGNADDYFAYGAQKVYVSDAPQLADLSTDVVAEALAQIANASGATTILIGSTKRGKELAGRLAQKLGCGAVTDAIGLAAQDGQLAAQRYALGGNTVATDVVTSERQVIAVMPRTFEATKQPFVGVGVRIYLKLR